MVEEAEVREEIKLLGIEPNSALEKAVVAVSLFLGNALTKGNFVYYMQLLEAEMQEVLKKRLDFNFFADSRTKTAIADWTAKKPSQADFRKADFSHLLTEVLTRVELGQKFEFENMGEPKAQLYLSFVPKTAFREQLIKGRHWKDPGVPGSHGEFTHRIQWYAIVKSEILAKIMEPSALFKKCGEVVAPNPSSKEDTTDLWEFLCDRARFKEPASSPYFVAKDENDFRNPERCNEFLKGDLSRDTHPLLRTFLELRFKKRDKMDLMGYIGKKLEQKTGRKMSEEARKVMALQGTIKEDVLLQMIGGKEMLSKILEEIRGFGVEVPILK